jgi:oxygen-independent coproporphyrinogen-3 oxidase
VQQAIGRLQPFKMLENAAQWTRACGISQLNFDLMYGLPKQSLEDLRFTVQKAASLNPDRVALFGYAHMPTLRKNQRLIDESQLPNADLRFAQSHLAAEELIKQGYEMVGFDHFAARHDALAIAARNGTLKRNFQGYGTDEAEVLIGFGASAISTLPAGYAQNTADTKAYMAQIDAGLSGLTRGHPTSNQDKGRRAAINALLCEFSLDLNALALPLDLRLSLQRDLQKLTPYADIGMVRLEDSRIEIMPEAQIFARLIASVFDSYLPEQVLNHAVAV